MKTNGELRARISSLEIQRARSKREIEQQCEEFLSKGAKATSMLCDADARIAELERQQNVLVDRLLGASNYIDRLGGNSAVFRQSLVAVKGETP